MTKRNITLSRYFDENVKLVSDMCSRCYEECVDVKIISVNLKFLNQIEKHLKQFNILQPQSPHLNSCNLECLDECHCGFSEADVTFFLNKSKQFNNIVKTREAILDKLKEKIVPINNSHAEESYLNEVENPSEENKNDIKSTELISCKTRINKYLRKNTENGKMSQYFENETELEASKSKYFSLEMLNEGKTSISLKQEINLKTVEICTSHIKLESNAIDYESEYLRTLTYNTLPFDTKIKVDVKKEDLENGNIHKSIPIWTPPKSPHNLIEEVLYHDPWALLVATIFLNRTACMCARPYVFWFLKENPHPLKVLERKQEDLQKYFVNLGLQRTRSVQVWRMSHDFVYQKWENVRELYGIGKYGEDAFKMFYLGDSNVEPKDRFLRIYKAWFEKVFQNL